MVWVRIDTAHTAHGSSEVAGKLEEEHLSMSLCVFMFVCVRLAGRCVCVCVVMCYVV